MIFNIPSILYYSSGIYSITSSIDNRFYIGSTVCFKRRFQDHKSRLNNKNHNNKYIQAFANKYGTHTLSFNLLYLCKNTCLVFNEKLWIDKLKPQFNIKPIITRPYFDDELLYDIQSIKSPLESLRIEFNENSSSVLKGKPAIEHLNFFEELQYYSGDWPSCEWPKKEYIKKEKKFKLSKYPREKKRQLRKILKDLHNT